MIIKSATYSISLAIKLLSNVFISDYTSKLAINKHMHKLTANSAINCTINN